MRRPVWDAPTRAEAAEAALRPAEVPMWVARAADHLAALRRRCDDDGDATKAAAVAPATTAGRRRSSRRHSLFRLRLSSATPFLVVVIVTFTISIHQN